MSVSPGPRFFVSAVRKLMCPWLHLKEKERKRRWGKQKKQKHFLSSSTLFRSMTQYRLQKYSTVQKICTLLAIISLYFAKKISHYVHWYANRRVTVCNTKWFCISCIVNNFVWWLSFPQICQDVSIMLKSGLWEGQFMTDRVVYFSIMA